MAVEDIGQMIAAAGALARDGRADEAAGVLNAVLARDPAQPAALNSLGMIALGRRDHAAAAALFDRAIAADPQAGPLRMNLATAARALGDDDRERAALLAALAVDQRDLMANIRLAELHERRGERGGANARWSGVLALTAQMADRPPQLEALIARAQDYVAAQSAAFGAAIDDGLAATRATLSSSQRRRFDASVDAMLGRRRLYANECHGFHFGFLPPDEFFDRALTPWLAELEAATPAIRAECRRLIDGGGAGFEPYVSMEPGTPANKWSPLDNNADWSARYLWRYGERQEAACAACPETAALLARMPMNDMPRRGPTAFFSVLKPRTRLPAHSGVSNARAIVHLPLIVPPGCGFRVGGETRAWREGEAFVFDDTIEHEAWNDSDLPRAVLIFDIWNPHLSDVERTLLRTFFAVTDESGLNPGGPTSVAD